MTETTETTERSDTRDQLADYAHEAWSGWMRHMFALADRQDGRLVIPTWATNRWARLMNTPFQGLTPAEKESDYIEADRMLNIMQSSKKPRLKGTWETFLCETTQGIMLCRYVEESLADRIGLPRAQWLHESIHGWEPLLPSVKVLRYIAVADISGMMQDETP